MKTDTQGNIVWEVPFPTTLPAVVHRATRFASEAWSGELRTVVDDEQLVIRTWHERRGWHYFLVPRDEWEIGHIQEGPLPEQGNRQETT